MTELRISFETEGFPSGTVANGMNDLQVTWDDILWAAMTVGRPNRYFVFRYGDASRYEAIFRWSLTRMALEQRGPGAFRLRRTKAAKALDPTEKGAVSYFLGMTFCKLFATKLLDTPWLLHLDVFRPDLDVVLSGRSRPDLIGRQKGTAQWHAFECKGRVSNPDLTVKRKAKEQAQCLVAVGSTSCTLHIGAITYFQNDILRFFWRDPEPVEGRKIRVPFTSDAWRYYYAPFAQLFFDAGSSGDKNGLVSIHGLDLQLGIHPAIANHLKEHRWDFAVAAAAELSDAFHQNGYQPDGLVVKAGKSWKEPFDESSSEEHRK